MSDRFMPSMGPLAIGQGNPKSKVLIIIDHPATDGLKSGKVLGGPSLNVYQEVLHMAGVITNDVYLVAAVPDNANPKTWWKGGNTKRPTRNTEPVEQHIRHLINTVKPNIVLAMGDLTAYLLTGTRKLVNDRGYIVPSVMNGVDVKVMPVLDIKAMSWSNYIWRYYLAGDIKKAYKNSEKRELTYEYEPDVRMITNFEKAEVYLKAIREMAYEENLPISIDIEVENFQVSHIGFSLRPPYGASIPFHNSIWNEEEETVLWILVAELLGDKRITMIGQNCIFDIHFLLITNNIFTRCKVDDTMMAQSIILPDMLKGLGFLGSTYLNQAPWKDMVSFNNIKEES